MNGVLGALHLERQQRKEYAESLFEVHGHPGGVIVREKHGECLGASVWASSEVLTRFLAARLESQYGVAKPPLVLELGCGVGLPGIFCALKGCSVTLTDRDEVGGRGGGRASGRGQRGMGVLCVRLCRLYSQLLCLSRFSSPADTLRRAKHRCWQ